MKIVYFIAASDFGRGGHYYSLFETATETSKYEDVTIISVGTNKSPVLEQFQGKYIHVRYTGVLSTLLKLFKLVRKQKVDVLHAFDIQSFFYAQIISKLDKTPIVLTRCGGANPENLPFNKEIIVYSTENLKFLKNKKKFENSNLSLIPNRVSVEQQDYKKIAKVRDQLKFDSPVILRIARISSSYKKSILQSIKLTQLLNKKGVPAQLLIIGYIQDKKVYDELIVHQSDNIHFLTDSEFTVNASSLIDIADFVVGTGRGFMEASLLSKVMLAPTANTDIPTLVNNDRVQDIFEINFSQRYHEKRDEADLFDEILDSFETFKEEKTANLVSFAKENFASENIYKRHLPIYKRAKPAEILVSDLAYQVLITLRPRYQIKKLFNKEY